MLERTRRFADQCGVGDQVSYQEGDVGALPFEDGEFDLVASFTGLHCFPDPHLAVQEMGRVTHAGGVLTGSALLNDTGDLRTLPVRGLGRLSGLLGPSATKSEVTRWMSEAGFTDVTLRTSGAMAYFRGVKA